MESQKAQYARVMAKAVSDPNFRERLVGGDSEAALAELGIKVPEGMTVNFVADTETTMNIVLPKIAVEGELSEDELDTVAGGFGTPAHSSY